MVDSLKYITSISRGGRWRRCRDRLVVGFITTYAISAYHHWCCELESRSGLGVQHYVIKFVSNLWQVGGFLRVLTNKIGRHNITVILLKVALNIIKLTERFRNLMHSVILTSSPTFRILTGLDLQKIFERAN